MSNRLEVAVRLGMSEEQYNKAVLIWQAREEDAEEDFSSFKCPLCGCDIIRHLTRTTEEDFLNGKGDRFEVIEMSADYLYCENEECKYNSPSELDELLDTVSKMEKE